MIKKFWGKVSSTFRGLRPGIILMLAIFGAYRLSDIVTDYLRTVLLGVGFEVHDTYTFVVSIFLVLIGVGIIVIPMLMSINWMVELDELAKKEKQEDA